MNVPTSVDSGDAKCVLFAHELVGSLLTFPGEATVSELVALEALMSPFVRAIENCKGKARQETHVDFIRSKTGGGADRAVLGKVDIGKVYVPAVLFFIAYHDEHLGHRVVYPLGSAVTTGVIRTRGEFTGVIVREGGGWATPTGYRPVHQYVGSTFSCKFGSCDRQSCQP